MPLSNYVLSLLLASAPPSGHQNPGVTLGADAITQPAGGATNVCDAASKDPAYARTHVAVKTISWGHKRRGHHPKAQFSYQKRGLHDDESPKETVKRSY